MPAKPKSPLAEALQVLFHGPAKSANPETVLLDYRDQATFTALWLDGSKSGKLSFCEKEIDLTDSTKQFLLIGNDPPEGIFDAKIPALAGINFRSHFTATSWLAAWKVKWEGENTAAEGNAQRGDEKRLPRIAVIDPRPAGNADGVARALQTILSARDAAGQPLVPGATVLNAPSLESICQWLAQDSVSRQARQNRQGGQLAPEPPHPSREASIFPLLRSTIWNELTSDREQHHALSNVLGAFLLSIQVGKGEEHPGDPWVQDYLLALVTAMGIEATLDQVTLTECGGSKRWITPAQQRAIEGVVLIDDMAELWAHFLRGATGFSGNAVFDEDSGRTYRESLELFGKDGFAGEIPDLPGRLKMFFESRKPHLSASDILGTESRLGENFVLFLDLRLFPSISQRKPGEAECAFFMQLRDFGFALLGSKRSLPWAGADERTRLKGELDRWAGDPTAGRGLDMTPRETLLPRLIALLDPTLPIVVFSSTHRTELIEPFRVYGNIITDFHKPVVSGLAGDWPRMVREMHAVFLAALERAVAILRVRRLLRPFQKSFLQN